MTAAIFQLFAAVFWLAALPASPATEARLRHNGITDTECSPPRRWTEVAARRTKYVVFGEVHGTRESPAFIGSLACGLASRGERLLIAIELDAIADPAIQSAWLLPEEQFDDALRATGWFKREDGVGSEAMFDLLQKLHRLSAHGSKIDVVAFNGFSDDEQRRRFGGLPGQGPHEAVQADNIRQASERGRYDHVLVLVGNLHARKTPVDDGRGPFKPMAMQLGPAEQVTSLKMRFSGGSMWNCVTNPNVTLVRGRPIPPDAMACGIHETRRSRVDLGFDAFVRLGAFPGEPPDPNYDGYYWLGQVNGSPPASHP